jgi:hypothetical protein
MGGCFAPGGSFSGTRRFDSLPLYSDRGTTPSNRQGHEMNLTSNLDWTSKLNIAAVCVSFTYILAVVTGLF